MKLALAAALAASMLVPATISRADDPILVQSQRAVVQKWVGAVSRDLDRSLARALRRPIGGFTHVEGFASVSFKCGSDGRPTEMKLTHNTANRELSKVALRAVRGLENLHPLPDSVGSGQRIRANIIVADSQESLERYARQAQKEEARQARLDRGNPDAAIAINVIAGTTA